MAALLPSSGGRHQVADTLCCTLLAVRAWSRRDPFIASAKEGVSIFHCLGHEIIWMKVRLRWICVDPQSDANHYYSWTLRHAASVIWKLNHGRPAGQTTASYAHLADRALGDDANKFTTGLRLPAENVVAFADDGPPCVENPHPEGAVLH